MSIQIQRESTEFIYVGVSGDVPSTAELAFLAAGVRPTEPDWNAGALVTSNVDPQWDEAVRSGASGDYFVALKIGSFGTGGLVLTAPDDFQIWARFTGAETQPVRICPVTLEMQ